MCQLTKNSSLILGMHIQNPTANLVSDHIYKKSIIELILTHNFGDLFILTHDISYHDYMWASYCEKNSTILGDISYDLICPSSPLTHYSSSPGMFNESLTPILPLNDYDFHIVGFDHGQEWCRDNL